MTKKVDLAGQKFGRLTVVEKYGSDKKQSLWLCKCECGNTKVVKRDNLQRGRTQSCGCLALQQKREAGKSQCHKYSRANNLKEYRAWESMIARCYYPRHDSHERYSTNSIQVCDKWKQSFKTFLDDMGKCPPGLTLERIDNSKGYFPENCKWASRKEQASNRSSNVWVTYNSQTKTLRQWEETFGWQKGTINNRLSLGWTIERALSTPVKERKKRNQLG